MNSKFKIALTVYIVSIMQMSAMAVSAAMSDISAAFPNAATMTVQMIMSLPSLIMCGSTLVSGFLAKKIQKKYIMMLGTLIIALSGVAGLLCHSSITALLCWAVVLGFGIGLFMPLNSSIIALSFDENERGLISGRQVTAATLGGMALSAIAGVLCGIQWHFVYFVYLLAIPGLLCAFAFLPRETLAKTAQKEKKGTISDGAWLYIVTIFLFICVYNAVPNNLTMYLTEKGMGTSTTAGMLTSAFLAGGAVAGIIYGIIGRRLQNKVIYLAFLLVIIGSSVLFVTNALPVVFVAVFVAGSSVSFTMSQCTVRLAVVEKPENMTVAMAALMAANSLAQSIAPVFTKLSAIVFHTDAVVYRFLLMSILGILLLVVTAVLLGREKKA